MTASSVPPEVITSIQVLQKTVSLLAFLEKEMQTSAYFSGGLK